MKYPLLRLVFSGIEIEDLKRAEEERERLRQVQSELAHIHRVTTMGELAASIVHETRQPISAVDINARRVCDG
jgi:C4-dicarboxylate-specific signal transduction histidine kinase